MKKPTDPTALCPSLEGAFNLLGHKWTGLVIHALASPPSHFCEVEKAIPGVSARVLSARMREGS